MDRMCYHPWVGLDISPQGEFKPCCKFTETVSQNFNEYKTSAKLAIVKEKFLSGDTPKECNRCWADEAAGLPSKRELDWEYVFNKTVPDLNKISVLSLPMGNTCNLACVTCNSASSSKWAAEERNLAIPNLRIYKHQKFYKDFEFMHSIIELAPHLMRVEFPGGEPLITGVKEHLEFISELPKTASLHYITNGTVFPSEEFLSLWTNFRHVDIQLSIDGTHNQFEYNRWPANWDNCVENYRKYLKFKEDNSNIQLSISHVVSIFTIFYLPEFCNWLEDFGFPAPYLGLLSRPSQYSITTLPKLVKYAIASKLTDAKFAGIIKHMMSADNSKEFGTTTKYVTLLDKQRNQCFATTFPELFKLIEG